MDLLSAFLLGFLQGATEFLPISSSGHLVVAETFFGVKEAGLTFDVVLHLGTLVAVVLYFRNDLLNMTKALLALGPHGAEAKSLRKLFVFICIGTVPGALAGLLLEKTAESSLRHPALVAMSLSLAGVLLLWAEKVGKRKRDLHTMNLGDCLIIGLSQALAIIPGVSRSGITMTAGLLQGLDRPSVARFSFLLSMPIILGAGLHNLPKAIRAGGFGDHFAFFATGFLAAAMSGYLCIAFLLRFVRNRSFAIFAYYRFLLSGLILLALLFWRP